MKIKVLLAVQFALILLLAAMLAGRYVSFRDTRTLVREPAVPAEATLAYTPAPPPPIPAAVLVKLARARAMMTPRVEQITEHIYQARGFALGNVQMVVTDEGLVIIDTTESPDAAREILKRFREITDRPVRVVVYTHGHLDHVLGTGVFLEEGTEVVSTRELVDFVEKDFVELREFHVRSRLNQAGLLAPAYARPLPLPALFRGLDSLDGLVRPTVTFEGAHSFVLGGRTFELYQTRGETPDHLMVWLPEGRVLFCGDLYYESFPNLSSPMLEPRPVKGWAESLERMLALEPEILVPGHTAPVMGRREVRQRLENYRRAILHVYEETVRHINRGTPVEQAAAAVRLPPDLEGLDYLQEMYGRVDWSVRGIYREKTGWYDGRGTGLAPLPPAHLARELVGLAGGANNLLARAVMLQQGGEHQLAVELCDVAIEANPGDKLARVVKAASLDALALTSGNLNMFGFYHSAAALERQAAGVSPR